ncbi:MAG: translation initiation factor [Synergistaceae bacterium]|nr:translation initiation factor [Synergistaceae bacterium]
MRSKKKKIDSVGDISLGIGESFGETIGNLIGVGVKPDEEDCSQTVRCEAVNEDKGKISLDFLKSVSRAILRRESAGRGGKTVTSVELRPAPNDSTAEALAKIMRKSFGCGSHVESRCIVLQGDMAERTALWLEKQGVERVVRGG